MNMHAIVQSLTKKIALVLSHDLRIGGKDSDKIIPVDEVIEAMGEVGLRMPVEFRETALGGLATTPTGQRVKAEMKAR